MRSLGSECSKRTGANEKKRRSFSNSEVSVEAALRGISENPSGEWLDDEIREPATVIELFRTPTESPRRCGSFRIFGFGTRSPDAWIRPRKWSGGV